MENRKVYTESFFAEIGKFMLSLPFAAILITVNTLWSGFVMAKLWNWFVVPIFGLRQLPALAAAGVVLLVACTRSTPYRDKQQSVFISMFYEYSRDALILLAGFVLKGFVSL